MKTIVPANQRIFPAISIQRFWQVDVLAPALFIALSLVFIYQTSFISLDGQRYFALADDAMISMRYAWNLSHGLGLVWNAGEHVEGYTNLLMTLIMSVATFLLDKKLATLAIQLLGIPTVLGVAFLTRQLARRLHPANDRLANLAFVGILFYIPLWAWSLMGMECGLLALLVLAAFRCGLHWLETAQFRALALASVFLGLAFLTRNEALLLAGLVFGYLAFKLWRAGTKISGFAPLFYAFLLYTLFVAGQLGFRFWYYGALVPNTYVLKVTGIPLSLKLRWGWTYIRPFLMESWPLLGLALLGMVQDRFKNAMLALFLGILLIYQVIVGGDSFGLWRILVPGIPFIFILAAAGCDAAGARFKKFLPTCLFIVCMLVANLPLLPELYSANGQTFAVLRNGHAVSIALGIDALTDSNATIGVLWAGVIPYYSGRKAVDFLGKTDPYIAHLPAHLGMPLVGHNKYDLQYSIRGKQPTYIQDFRWNKENLKPWVVQHYIRANYATPYGDITLILKRDDPTIHWEKATIIPWPEDK